MNFWGVEVKSGETFPVAFGEERVLHLSQACLGETKNTKSESVCLHINVEGKKLVLGTLHSERLPQQLFDLVFDKPFTISHNWKNGSVFLYGYQADQPGEPDSDFESEEDSEEEEEAIRLPIPNGNTEAKKEVKETKKEEKPVAANKKDAKQVTIVEPKKDDEDDSDDSDSDDSADSDSMSTDSGSDEEGVGKDSDDDSDDSDDSSDEEEDKEDTPKKPQSGKKRQNESAMETPTTDKKGKMSTPQKTDGKKVAVHVATPHPSKKPDAKSGGSKSNQKSPATGGAHCKSCNRNFKTEGGLEAHNQAKHASK